MILYPDTKELFSVVTEGGRVLGESLNSPEEVKEVIHEALSEGYCLKELFVKTEDLVFDQVFGSWDSHENRKIHLKSDLEFYS